MQNMRLSAYFILKTFIFIGYNGAVAADTQVTGYAKSFALAQDAVDNVVISSDTFYQSQNSFRLMIDTLSPALALQFHYEVSPVFSSRAPVFDSQTFSQSQRGYRFSDPAPELGKGSEKKTLYQNLDRFNLQLRMKSGDLTLGRQAITFGSARFINPTDVFLPFDVRTFNQEYRFGVDAIRFQSPLGQLGELDTGVILGDGGHKDNSAIYFQARTHISDIDIKSTLMRFSGQNLFSSGLETSLGSMGFWFEAAKVWGDMDYVRISTGLDYAFSEFTFGMMEYHFNEASSGNPDDYFQQQLTAPYQLGGVFLSGKNYLLMSLSQVFSPLFNMGMSVFLNLNDDSTYSSIKMEYNMEENLYLDAGLYHFRGDDIQPSSTPPLFQLESEFGGSPNLLFMSVRYYF